jgi:UDP-2-acetamido-3-amino-2,3-dideoxy-glucuronate N-acetyltransferase
MEDRRTSSHGKSARQGKAAVAAPHGRQAAEKPTLGLGAFLAADVEVEEHVTIGPHAVVLANSMPGGSQTVLRAESEVGANATVLPGVTLGIRSKVLPGSVVTRSVPPMAIVEGNPAHIVGFRESGGEQRLRLVRPDSGQPAVRSSSVQGVTLHDFRMVPDPRGNLSVGEFEREIPFKPKRYFVIFDVPNAETRGEHAHLRCEQFLVAVKGSVHVVADDGERREEFVLDQPNVGVYLPKLVWGVQYQYTPDAVLMVFASHYYDPKDYIRDYADFLTIVRRERAGYSAESGKRAAA